MTAIILISILSFLLLGFFAGSEMAYLSCNKLKLRHLADEGDPRAQIVMRFYRDPKRYLATILLGTNLMHVTFASLVTFVLENKFHVTQEWIIVAILTPFIVVFAETIPKDWFRQKADDFIYRFAPVLNLIDRLFSAVSKVLVFITDFLIAKTTPELKRDPFVTRDEFRYVIEESAKGGVLLEHERQLIHTILNLSSVRVEEVMVPVERFPKLPLESKVRDVKELARKTKTHVMLIYEEIPSLVVGLIYVFDTLFEPNEEKSLAGFLKAPFFISKDTSAEKALFLLQSKHASYAAVTNPQMEVIGVASIENLIRL